MDKDLTPVELLSKALDSMTPADRAKVLTWLLNRPAGPDIMAATRPATVGSLTMLAPHETTSLISRLSARRGEHQVVPIRLPTEQHSLLRDWCQEHGFAMATVVRGLVERFLEERGLLQRGTHEEP